MAGPITELLDENSLVIPWLEKELFTQASSSCILGDDEGSKRRED